MCCVNTKGIYYDAFFVQIVFHLLRFDSVMKRNFYNHFLMQMLIDLSACLNIIVDRLLHFWIV